MQSEQDRGTRSAVVLALGGVAAGVASAIWVLWSERERESGAGASVESAQRTLEQVRRGTSALRKEARASGRRARRETLREVARNQDKVMTMLRDARKKGNKRLQELERHAPDVLALAQEYLSRAESALEEARKSGSKQAEAARKEAEKRQRELRAALERAREEAPKKLQDVEARLVPRVRELEKQAAEALEQGRERAAEWRKHAESDILPEVRESAERVRERVGEQAKLAATVLEKGSTEAAHKLTEATDVVETRAREAGSAVAEGGRDLRSLVLWLAVGAAIVYAVFLNDEQRERVRARVQSWLGEAKATAEDIRGADGTFEQV